MDIMPALTRLGRHGWIWLSIALVACGGGGSSDSPAPDTDETPAQSATAQAVSGDTQRILESIYHNKRIPDGFYTENEPEPGVYQSIAHIKNVDIADPASLTDETPRYELCADTFDRALQWSTAATGNAGDLVDNRETKLFYEFTRVPAGRPDFRNLQRVFKCSIVDRSDIDLSQPDQYKGLYTQLPQSAESIKLLIEYFWSFSTANNYGHAVLSSTTTEADTHFLHTLEQARLTSAAESGDTCDRVDVYASHYRVEKLTGSISVSESHEQTISARYENDIISTCKQ